MACIVRFLQVVSNKEVGPGFLKFFIFGGQPEYHQSWWPKPKPRLDDVYERNLRNLVMLKMHDDGMFMSTKENWELFC